MDEMKRQGHNPNIQCQADSSSPMFLIRRVLIGLQSLPHTSYHTDALCGGRIGVISPSRN